MFLRSITLLLRVPCRVQMASNTIKTFVFLDLETTGLPFQENNKTKITELSIVAVEVSHLSAGVFPRVQNKLSLCFNPRKMISSESERITGLSNFSLEHLAPFTSTTVSMINDFLEHNPKPICFVAHNGNRFDYPILRAEVAKTGFSLIEDILCIDSLETFRDLHLQDDLQTNHETPSEVAINSNNQLPLELQDGFDEILCQALDEYENDDKQGLKRVLAAQKINETTPKRPTITKENLGIPANNANKNNSKKLKIVLPKRRLFGVSFKLTDVYQRLTNQEVGDAHQAEKDVIMLMTCAATLGDKFIEWANSRARKFADIAPMTPGRKIGT